MSNDERLRTQEASLKTLANNIIEITRLKNEMCYLHWVNDLNLTVEVHEAILVGKHAMFHIASYNRWDNQKLKRLKEKLEKS